MRDWTKGACSLLIPDLASLTMGFNSHLVVMLGLLCSQTIVGR